MSASRTVGKVVQPHPVLEGAGVKLNRVFPGRDLDFPDPFLLLDHFGSDDPADYLAGFPMHPHRGIETVTYMLEGEVHHKDSLGNAGVIAGGDVQWMTAGGGILHEEMPRPRNGRMEGFQLWVNLPSELKMSPPRYQEISAATIPTAEWEGEGSIRVIAGQFGGVKGPVTEIAADPTYLDVTLPAGVRFERSTVREHTFLAYIFEGEAEFGASARKVASPGLVVFGEGDSLEIRSGGSGARFLLFSGLPRNEPIVRYGPFVMNTEEEIQQAVEDLRAGTFVYGSN